MILTNFVHSPSFVQLNIIFTSRNILSAIPLPVIFHLLVVILKLAVSPILDENHFNNHATAGKEVYLVSLILIFICIVSHEGYSSSPSMCMCTHVHACVCLWL